MPDDLELSLPAVPAAVRRMRNAAAELAEEARLPETMVHDVRLAVSEAVTNSVRHGSTAGAEVVMRATLEPGRLEISISDRGPDIGSEIKPGLGLGLPIMTAVADDLQFDRAPSGTVVTMTFIAPADP